MLFKHGIAKGKSLTSYPTVKKDIEGFYQYKEDSTVVDGKIYLINLNIRSIHNNLVPTPIFALWIS